MANYKKPTYIIIQEAMAERIRFLEDDVSWFLVLCHYNITSSPILRDS